MPQLYADPKAKSASLSAVITRADGRIENLGVIAYYHRNPVLNWIGNHLIVLKEKVRGRTSSK